MSDPSTPAPRRRGPARRLDAARVVAAAIAILDAGGVSALSVRAVAAHLGVLPNTLYTYVTDRADLERAVAEQLLSGADLGLLADPLRQPRERVLRYATALRVTLLAHPGAAALLMTAPMDGPAAALIGELVMAAFEEAGLTAADAARGTYLMIVTVVGGVALEVAETDGRAPMPAEVDRIASRRAGMAAVPPALLPRTAAAADTIAAWVSTDQFDWMLRTVLDGILAQAAGISPPDAPRTARPSVR